MAARRSKSTRAPRRLDSFLLSRLSVSVERPRRARVSNRRHAGGDRPFIRSSAFLPRLFWKRQFHRAQPPQYNLKSNCLQLYNSVFSKKTVKKRSISDRPIDKPNRLSKKSVQALADLPAKRYYHNRHTQKIFRQTKSISCVLTLSISVAR